MRRRTHAAVALCRLMLGVALVLLSSVAWAACREGQEENARSGECQPIRETTKSLFGIPTNKQSSVSVTSVVSGTDTPTSAVLTGPDPGTAALIEDLRREISSLRDQLDIQTFELEKLRRRQRELYDDLDARLRQEERLTASMPMPGEGGSAPSSLVLTEPTQSADISQSSREPSRGVSETETTGSSSNASNAAPDAVTNTGESSVDTIVVGSVIQTTATLGQTLNSTTVSNAVSISEEETYDAAFDLLKQSLYADAAVAFTQFIQRFPNSELTDDAWYWMGEARFVTREFSQSLGAFQNVINKFMDSPRIPASYLKVGYIQYEYGAYINARETLNFVLSSFPNHRIVVNAKARLEKMDREGY